jgi:hypothetical protein
MRRSKPAFPHTSSLHGALRHDTGWSWLVRHEIPWFYTAGRDAVMWGRGGGSPWLDLFFRAVQLNSCLRSPISKMNFNHGSPQHITDTKWVFPVFKTGGWKCCAIKHPHGSYTLGNSDICHSCFQLSHFRKKKIITSSNSFFYIPQLPQCYCIHTYQRYDSP